MERTQVWAVALGTAGPDEVEGELSLDPEARILRFESFAEDADGGRRVVSSVRVELDRITKVRRIRGSPVLLVHHRSDAGRGQLAFYFARPPRLDRTLRRDDPLAPNAPPMERFGFRRSERRERRRAAAYLSVSNRRLKGRVQAWERAIVEAMASGRGEARPG